MSTREEDFVSSVFVVSTHTPVLFFSSIGKVYKLKAFPPAAWAHRNRAANPW